MALCQNWITIGRWVIAAGASAQGRATEANDFEDCHICEINEVPQTQDYSVVVRAMLDEHGGMGRNLGARKCGGFCAVALSKPVAN